MHRVRDLIVVTLLVVAAGAAAQEPATVLYVAANGNDAWSGRIEAPKGDDGPLATLAGARDAVRALKRDGKLAGPVTVLIRGGTYRLGEPVVFGPADSGSADCPIVYAAYPGEEPVVSGGREIGGWRPAPGGKLWVTRAPSALRDPWKLRQLFVNGERRRLARSPNEGQFQMLGKAAPLTDPETGQETDVSKSAFRFPPGSVQDWPDVTSANVVVHYSWETGIFPIKRVDLETNTVYVGGASKWPFTQQGGKQPFYVEGTMAALDAPGEGCLDAATGQLYYYPMPDETPANTTIVAPVSEQLIVLQGDPDAGQFVDYLGFKGLRLWYGACHLEPEGHCDWQAAYEVPGTIHANGARYCSIEDCEIAHYGLYGVWFQRGCKYNRIVGNHIHDMGAGGVRLGEGGRPATPEAATEQNVVSNNYIHGSGEVYGGAVGGVWVGQSSDNEISHNDICDTTWMAVSVGWSWGYSPTTAHRNEIAYNHIHHIGRWLQPDMGAIYTLGLSPGTRIHHNHIHDVTAGGIYPDEGSTDIVIEDNLVDDVRHGGLTVHYGRNLLVQNNIFAFGWSGQIHLGRRDKESSLKLERNIVYFDHGRLFQRESDLESDYNVYWLTDDEPLLFPGDLTWEAWQATGHDTHSVVADPLFEDAAARDFRLRPESPALKLGFRPLDLSEVGLVGAKEWVDLPKALPGARLSFTDLPDERPQLVDDGFENTPVSVTADDANTYGETQSARIRVTTEQAATGKHSLKFQDAPGLDQSWNPHLYYMPHLRSGVVRLSYDLRLGEGAIVANEWRDGSSPYRSGPSLRVDAGGVLTANGQEVATLPPNTWVHIETTNGLGDAATGRYELVVTVAGRAPVRVSDLPGNAAMKSLDWLGFVSDATEVVVFYLDNVKLEVVGK